MGSHDPGKVLARDRADPETTLSLSPGLTVEFTGDSFFLTSEGAGHDLTFSLEPDIAVRLAEFILSRRRPR